MNTPVKFEIAKLLKEKGFDKTTLLCYDKCDMLSSYVETVFKPKNYNTSGYVVSAPTIVEVVMWLYEKHGIWVSVKKDYHNGALLGFESIIDNEDGLVDCGIFDSPTEAYEAAIEYALKNLI